MKTFFMKFSILLLSYDCVSALILPEDLTSLLNNAVYPQIPPIKKGTDSRLGVGFNLGKHADVQVVLELGPQQKTEPIGNGESRRRRMPNYLAALRGDLGPLAQMLARLVTRINLRQQMENLKQMENTVATTKLENVE